MTTQEPKLELAAGSGIPYLLPTSRVKTHTQLCTAYMYTERHKYIESWPKAWKIGAGLVWTDESETHFHSGNPFRDLYHWAASS